MQKQKNKVSQTQNMLIELFTVRIPEYRKSPILFAREVFHFEPDDWQKSALIDLSRNPRVAIKSGQGVGKTGIEAVAALWFLTCFPFSRVVATAPTKQQLHDVLWSEITKAYNEDTTKVGESEEMRAEGDSLQRIIDTLSTEYPIAEVLSEAIYERECCGIAYLECIRDMNGNVVDVINVNDTETIRKSKLEDTETECISHFKGEKVTRKKRFRRYRQEISGKTVYFKSFGDPRIMDRRTGTFWEEGMEPLTLCNEANELLELRIRQAHYGEVRWAGQIVCIDGAHAAEMLNDNYFHKGRHTPMMVLITGGKLTSEARAEVQSYVDSVQGEQAQHKILVLEAKANEGAVGFDEKERPSVEIKDLTPMLQKDALFTAYLDDNRKKAQSAFRLPDIYVAYTSDYNRSTVYAAMKLTDEQVFRGEREKLEWVLNQQLLASDGFRHVHVAVKGPDLADTDSVNKRFEVCAQNGGLPMNKAKDEIYHILGSDECEDYAETWGNYPLSLVNAMQATGIPPDTAPAPTQGNLEEAGETTHAVLREIRKALKGYAHNGDD